MNITSFKDVGNLLSGLSTNLQVQGASRTGNTAASESQAQSFQTVWNAQAGKSDAGVQQNAEQPVKARKPQQKDDDRPADAKAEAVTGEEPTKTERSENAQEQPGPDKPELTEEELEAATEVLAAAVTTLTEQITQILDLPEEELQQIMTDLNLKPEDLLIPENLTKVAFEAMGVENKLELLTDEEHFGTFRELTENLEQTLSLESGHEELSLKELATLVQEAAQTETEELPQTKSPAEPETVQTQFVEPEPQKEVKETKMSEAGPLMEATDRPTKRADDGKVSESEIREVTTQEGSTLGAEAMLRRSRNGNGTGQQSQHHAEEHPQSGPQILPEPEMAVHPETIDTTAAIRYSDTQEIANQILDYIRTQVKADMTSVEMQLHPASLGTMQIQVANKGGVLTANFVTQNEQVKAAIETQMVQLRERFEEQGIKVEAIEVTVQTHQFEQNLEQRNDRQDRQNEGAARRTRRIRLGADLTAGDLEDLDEDARIAAEMMEINGNTVDYTV